MREYLGLYQREILIIGCGLVLAILVVAAIAKRYFIDKRGPWTL
jgi:hypothetical protein